MNVRTKFEVLSFTCSWDNIMGYPKNLGSSWIRPLVSKILMGFCSDSQSEQKPVY